MPKKKKLVLALKRHFRKASETGTKSLDQSLRFIKKRPVETALFSVLAGSILSKVKK